MDNANWDGDIFAALKARLAETAAPAAPASVPAQDATAADADDGMRKLFERTLIVGASVSAGYRAESPGERLARRYGTRDGVVSVARPGATGAAEVEKLTDERLGTATVVVGVDLFFWDSRRDCEAGLNAVDELFRRLATRSTPAVVATVPGGGECGTKLNSKIAARCAADKTCALLDLAALYAKTAARGADLDGRHYTVRELQPDGLHLSDAGSELMARAIVDAVAAKRLSAN